MEFISRGPSARTGFLLFGTSRNVVWQYFHVTLSFLTTLVGWYCWHPFSQMGKLYAPIGKECTLFRRSSYPCVCNIPVYVTANHRSRPRRHLPTASSIILIILHYAMNASPLLTRCPNDDRARHPPAPSRLHGGLCLIKSTERASTRCRVNPADIMSPCWHGI